MNKRNVTLTLYANAFGLSYLISKSPKQIIEFGMKHISKKESNCFLKRLDVLLDYFQPMLIILRDFDHPKHKISKKYQGIWQAIEKRAEELGLEIYKYSREQVKEVFASFQAKTKFEISEVISSWYPQLKGRSPRKRKPWLSEDNQMGIFDAFSLMLTHSYLQD